MISIKKLLCYTFLEQSLGFEVKQPGVIQRDQYFKNICFWSWWWLGTYTVYHFLIAVLKFSFTVNAIILLFACIFSKLTVGSLLLLLQTTQTGGQVPYMSVKYPLQQPPAPCVCLSTTDGRTGETNERKTTTCSCCCCM